MNSKVFLSKCKRYEIEKIEKIIENSFKELNVLDRIKNKRVLLKPNLLAPSEPEKAVTTHPSVVEAAGKVIQKYGGEVIVGDSPGVGTKDLLYKKTGMKKVVEDNNFKFADFNNRIEIKNHSGKIVKKFTLAKAFKEADVIISVAKLKTHSMTYYTGAIKNMFGMVPGLLKPQFHYRFSDKKLFAQMLLDLIVTIKPDIGIIDAVTAMEGDGPRNGTPRNVNAILVSKDFVSLDSTACRLVKINPYKILHIKKGAKGKLGKLKEKNIDVVGDTLDNLKVKKFKQPPKETGVDSIVPLPGFLKEIIKRIFVPKPKFDHEKCILCGECIRVCPSKPKSLKIQDDKVKINRETCIRCFCCQEMCPEGAIKSRRNLWF